MIDLELKLRKHLNSLEKELNVIFDDKFTSKRET
jgi:hypothetical protein